MDSLQQSTSPIISSHVSRKPAVRPVQLLFPDDEDSQVQIYFFMLYRFYNKSYNSFFPQVNTDANILISDYSIITANSINNHHYTG